MNTTETTTINDNRFFLQNWLKIISENSEINNESNNKKFLKVFFVRLVSLFSTMIFNYFLKNLFRLLDS